MKIIGLVGSISGSKTGYLMDQIHVADGVAYERIDLSDYHLSFADGRDFREYTDDTTKLVRKLIEADGIIIAFPVYQASIPGVLKNLFDLLPPGSMASKTVGVIVNSGSSHYYEMVHHQLFPILYYLKMRVVAKYVFVTPDAFEGQTVRDDIVLRIESLVMSVLQSIEYQQELEAKLYDF